MRYNFLTHAWATSTCLQIGLLWFLGCPKHFLNYDLFLVLLRVQNAYEVTQILSFDEEMAAKEEPTLKYTRTISPSLAT